MQLTPIKMADKRFDEVCDLLQLSYPNSCVLWINKVENQDLYKKYLARREHILQKRGKIEEHTVFHGTKEANINSIAIDGFDASLNKISAYGRGTYLASQASYSKEYSDVAHDGVSHMFVCKLLVGKITKGRSNMIINTEDYDCAVDNTDNPMIFVTPYNDGVIPEYIVAFYKNAR